MSANFRFEKLYLDCIDDSGNCLIIYLAKLKLSFIRLTYSGVIFSDSNGITTEKSSLKKLALPVAGNTLNFTNPQLQISGNWKSIDGPLASLLYSESPDRKVYWDCHHPKALADIVYLNKTYKGLGYAETLFLTIKPWKLPVEELRWGRFLSENYTVIWICWTGSNPVNSIFCNGIEYNDGIFEAGGLTFGSGVYSLTFDEISVIREGKLSNVLSGMKWLQILFNRRFLNTVEIKYKAKSNLRRNTGFIFGGQALYEIVTWKK